MVGGVPARRGYMYSLALALLVTLHAQEARAQPTATVSSGTLLGGLTPDKKVAYFRDVPYALAERFEAPRAPEKWTGVRDSTKLGPGCMQHKSTHNPDVPVNQTEDCTRLNIYTPASAMPAAAAAAAAAAGTGDDSAPAALLPVQVWLHGGAFKEGSSFGPFNLYDGSKLAGGHGVVVVSCNYRLDVFGALVFAGGFAGNQGFLDQRACLEWVRDEIHHFGGDASMVTAWGQSAGAESILLHMASKGSKGLFHRAILESAPALSIFEAEEAGKLGQAFAKALGCRGRNATTTAAQVACMKAASADDVVRAADKAQSGFLTLLTTLSLKHPTSSFLPFKPSVDGTLFTQQPLALLLSNEAPAAVPSLIGFNHDEMWALLDSLPKWVKGLEVEAALALLFGARTASAAWKHYSPLYAKGDDLSVISKILTDYLFTCSSQAVAAKLPGRNFVYQFDHLDSFGPTLFGKFGLPQCERRACHMAEIPFVFGNKGPDSFNVTFTPSELNISRRLMDSFTAFAKTGAPDSSWPVFNASSSSSSSSSSSRSGLVINETAVVGPLGIAASVCTDIWDKTGYLH